MALIRQYLNIIIAVITIIITLYLSSIYYNNKINKVKTEYNTYKLVTENNIKEQQVSILTQNNKLKEENLTLNNKLKEVENENYKNYEELQKANSTIKSSVINNSKRLHINAICPKSTVNTDSKTKDNTTSTMDDGISTKAIIDPRDGGAIITITEKADKYKSQLEALQKWVNTLIVENNK